MGLTDGAKIQEEFDCALYERVWNNFNTLHDSSCLITFHTLLSALHSVEG